MNWVAMSPVGGAHAGGCACGCRWAARFAAHRVGYLRRPRLGVRDSALAAADLAALLDFERDKVLLAARVQITVPRPTAGGGRRGNGIVLTVNVGGPERRRRARVRR